MHFSFKKWKNNGKNNFEDSFVSILIYFAYKIVLYSRLHFLKVYYFGHPHHYASDSVYQIIIFRSIIYQQLTELFLAGNGDSTMSIKLLLVKIAYF